MMPAPELDSLVGEPLEIVPQPNASSTPNLGAAFVIQPRDPSGWIIHMIQQRAGLFARLDGDFSCWAGGNVCPPSDFVIAPRQETHRKRYFHDPNEWNGRLGDEGHQPGERLDNSSRLDTERHKNLGAVEIDQTTRRSSDSRAVETTMLQSALAESPKRWSIGPGEGLGVLDRAVEEVGLGEDDRDRNVNLAPAFRRAD